MMKFFVWKKRFVSLVGDIIALDLLYIPFVIFVIDQSDSIEVSFLLSTIIVILNIYTFFMMRFEGSIISFDENNIKCVFLKWVRCTIAYNEIQDYGTFKCGTLFQRQENFIYISRFKLSEKQRGVEVYRLYKKTKRVLVLQYNEEVFSLVKNKCTNIIPHKISAP